MHAKTGSTSDARAGTPCWRTCPLSKFTLSEYHSQEIIRSTPCRVIPDGLGCGSGHPFAPPNQRCAAPMALTTAPRDDPSAISRYALTWFKRGVNE